MGNGAAMNSAAASAAVSRKAQLREAAARKRQQQNRMVIAAGGVIALLVVAVIGLDIWRSQPVVGEQTFSSQGNLHIQLGTVSSIAYNSTPPTSGPHYENLAAWGAHSTPVRYEHLIHNLEDGGVVVYYQCPEGCPELVAELTTLLEPYWNAGRHVTLAPNDPTWTDDTATPQHKDMGARIAVTAWQRLLTMEAVDAEAIRAFIERYEGIDNHRG